jgi:eukaryotic-like serine/threonine-protein kinase
MVSDHRTAPVAREEFLRNLRESGLLSAHDLAALSDTGETDGEALAKQLVAAGKLTAYQANAVAHGRFADLRIGGYDVLDLLGKGAMGTVYKARHRTMKRIAAIKVLSAEIAHEGTFAARFQREVESLAQLHHPNVIMAFDAGESPAGPFLAMEFVQGHDLASEVLDRGPLCVADAVDCVLQAARGLAYAHEQGLVHRDVKPANLMRDVRGVVKVADLGLARMKNPQAIQSESALTQAGGVVGTVDYMAPEQAVDSTTVDHRADIYSLGCTLFFLITGRPLYSGTSLMSLLLQHRDAPAPALVHVQPGVPAFVDAIYQRMVAKKPADRYPSMNETANALEEALKSLQALGMTAPSRPVPQSNASLADATMVFNSPGRSTDHGGPPGRPTDHGADRSSVPPMLADTLVREPAPAREQPAPAASLPRPRPHLFFAAVLAVALVSGAAVLWWRWPFSGVVTPPSQPSTPTAPTREGPFVVILNGGGSTFIQPLMQTWAGIYEKGVRVDYQAVGSFRGMDGVMSRAYQFGCSDAPLTDPQLATAKKSGVELTHVPLVLGAVVPAYNLPSLGKTQLRFTGPILADIYLGKITNWKDPAIQVANPRVDLPDLPITTVHRADRSGTTYIWTDYLSAVSGEWKTKIGATMLPSSRPGGVEGKGNNGVANQVSRNVGALGYLELSYALENNLHFGQVKNREGKFITPTLESVTAAAGALTDIPTDLRLPLIDGTGEDTYPIVGMTYALLHTNQTSNPSGRELVAFLRWASHEGQAYVKHLHYAPLPPELVGRIDGVLEGVKLAPK